MSALMRWTARPAPRVVSVADALARLEVCARHRDAEAAAEVLERLRTGSDDGAWLALQMASSGTCPQVRSRSPPNLSQLLRPCGVSVLSADHDGGAWPPKRDAPDRYQRFGGRSSRC